MKSNNYQCSNRSGTQFPTALILYDNTAPADLDRIVNNLGNSFRFSKHEVFDAWPPQDDLLFSQKLETANVVVEALDFDVARAVYAHCLENRKHVIATNPVAVASRRQFYSELAAREGVQFRFRSSFNIDNHVLKMISDARRREPIRKIDVQMDSAVNQFFQLLPTDGTRTDVINQLWPKWSPKIVRSDRVLMGQLRLLAFIAFGSDLRHLRVTVETVASREQAMDADSNCRWFQVLHLKRYSSVVGAEISMPTVNPYASPSERSLEVCVEMDSGEIILECSTSAGTAQLAGNLQGELNEIRHLF